MYHGPINVSLTIEAQQLRHVIQGYVLLPGRTGHDLERVYQDGTSRTTELVHKVGKSVLQPTVKQEEKVKLKAVVGYDPGMGVLVQFIVKQGECFSLALTHYTDCRFIVHSKPHTQDNSLHRIQRLLTPYIILLLFDVCGYLIRVLKPSIRGNVFQWRFITAKGFDIQIDIRNCFRCSHDDYFLGCGLEGSGTTLSVQ